MVSTERGAYSLVHDTSLWRPGVAVVVVIISWFNIFVFLFSPYFFVLHRLLRSVLKRHHSPRCHTIYQISFFFFNLFPCTYIVPFFCPSRRWTFRCAIGRCCRGKNARKKKKAGKSWCCPVTVHEEADLCNARVLGCRRVAAVEWRGGITYHITHNLSHHTKRRRGGVLHNCLSPRHSSS